MFSLIAFGRVDARREKEREIGMQRREKVQGEEERGSECTHCTPLFV